MFGDAQTVCPLTVEMNKRCILYKKNMHTHIYIRARFYSQTEQTSVCFPVIFTKASGILMNTIVHIELFVTILHISTTW